MKNYYHLKSLENCPLCNGTCKCPACSPRRAEAKSGSSTRDEK